MLKQLINQIINQETQDAKLIIYQLQQLKKSYISLHELEQINFAINQIEQTQKDELDNEYELENILINHQQFADELLIDAINSILKHENEFIQLLKQIFFQTQKQIIKFWIIDKLIRLEQPFNFYWNEQHCTTSNLTSFKYSNAKLAVDHLLKEFSSEKRKFLFYLIFNEETLKLEFFLNNDYQLKLIDLCKDLLARIELKTQ